MGVKNWLMKGVAEIEASVRQGAKEIGQILPAFNDGIKPVEEPGTMFNPVSREVYEQRHPPEADAPSFESEMARAAEQAAGKEVEKGYGLDLG